MQRLGRFSVGFIAVAVVAVSLYFGLGFAFSQTPELGVDEIEPSLTGGYDVGVPIEVNGVLREVDAGDVIFTGTFNEIDHGAILDAALDGVTETATALQLIREVLALPAGYCDFGELSLGASLGSDIVDTDAGASYTEYLRFEVNNDCDVSFSVKDVEEERPDMPTPEPSWFGGGLSSFFGSSPVHAVGSGSGLSQSDGIIDHYGSQCDEPVDSILGSSNEVNGGTRYRSGSSEMYGWESLYSINVDVSAGLVLNDGDRILNDLAPLTLSRIYGGSGYNPYGYERANDYDCVAFVTSQEVNFGYNWSNATSFLNRHTGTCAGWALLDIETGFADWEINKQWTPERGQCVKTTNGSNYAKTSGGYRSNRDNAFFHSLDRAGVQYNTSIKNRVFSQAVAAEVSRFGNYSKVSYSCKMYAVPVVYLSSHLGDLVRIRLANWNMSLDAFNTRNDYIAIPYNGIIGSELACRVRVH